MHRPLVSIVIPAWNSATYVGAAISGALAQTYENIEVVVVDDGSTDGTARIAAAYGSQVRLVSQANHGVAHARNAGIRASSGAFIALCDSDDILLSCHVETAMQTLESADRSHWVAHPFWLFRESAVERLKVPNFMGKPVGDEQVDAILAGNFVPVFSIFPRAMFDSVGGFDEELRYCEDWDFWLRCILSGWRVQISDEPSVLYRITEGSLSQQTHLMAQAHKTMLRKLSSPREDARLSSAQRADVERRTLEPSCIAVARDARLALRDGDIDGARRLFTAAAELNPWDLDVVRKSRILRLARPTRLAQLLLAARS